MQPQSKHWLGSGSLSQHISFLLIVGTPLLERKLIIGNVQMHNLVLLSSKMVTWVVAGAMDTLVEGDISDSSTVNVSSYSTSSSTTMGIFTFTSETDEFKLILVSTDL